MEYSQSGMIDAGDCFASPVSIDLPGVLLQQSCGHLGAPKERNKSAQGNALGVEVASG